MLTDLRDHTKKLIFHPRLLPAIVIEDPELHAGLPARITAAVGMDALSHNLEAFCAPTFHPLADGIAVEGMRLIKEWLPAACAHGSNLEARGQMLIASTMGATAFQKGLGAMHSLSHPCSANLDTHHGLTNGVVMPYVLVFNRRAIKDKMKRLASYLGLKRPSFGAVLDWVVELRSTIGIPNTLAELGVTEAHVASFARMAMADPSTPSNPVKLSVRKFEKLYRNAISGKL